MCGLVGLAGVIELKHREAFEDLLQIDVLRGPHATGVASLDMSWKVDWLKREGLPQYLIYSKVFDRVVNCAKRALMGHNRLATKGSHHSDNAHPFYFKHITGAHNGTISDYYIKGLGTHAKFETDSECIFNEINILLDIQVPYNEAVKEVLGKIKGAWALNFFLPKEHRVCLIRNKERPLCFAYSEDRKVLLWASEAWMLRGICNRRGIKLEDDKVWICSEDTLYSWEIPTGTGAFASPARFQDIKEKQENWSSTGNFQMGGANTTTTKDSLLGSGTTATTSTKRHTPKSPAYVTDHKNKHFKPPYKDPYTGEVIKRPDFNQRIKDGRTCVYCNNHEPVWGEEVLFLKKNPMGGVQYACKKCVHNPEIMQILNAMR